MPRDDKSRQKDNAPLEPKPARMARPKSKPRFDKQGSTSPSDKKTVRSVHKQGFTTRPTLRINLGAIKSNYLALQDKVGTVKIGASVKADAYGLGVEPVSRALYGAGCRTFFVATAGEGKILREAIGDNASIYVLNGPAPQDLTLYFTFKLKPVINSLEQARIWLNEADRAKHAPFTALHIDTGMNRLGLSATDVEQLSKNTSLYKALGPDLIMSHLACAPDANNPMNATQLERFQRYSAQFPITPLSLIGYNASYRAESDMKIAILGAGYADGIPVASSFATSGQKTKPSFVTLLKQRVPIVGRVSMDLTMVDISRLNKAPNLGDWAEFRGENLQTDAQTLGTVNYELLVRLGQRCRRTYQKS